MVLQTLTLPEVTANPWLQAMAYSLDYLATPKAGEDYRKLSRWQGVYPPIAFWPESAAVYDRLIQTSPDNDAFQASL